MKTPRALVSRLRRFFFGEDFFITYARADATPYAATLANRLLDSGFTCFVDQWHPVADAEIPSSIRRALLHASTQVIVATPAAAVSKAVAEEILLFAKTGRPIVPIDVEQAIASAPWAPRTVGVARSIEDPRAIAAGEPSPAVVRRLVETFRYRRRSWRIRASFGVFAFTSLLLGAGSLWQAQRAEQQRRVAVGAAAEASRQRDAADRAASSAEDERRQRMQALDRLKDEALRTEQQARAAEARGRLADSRALAISSRTQPLTIDQKLLLAVQAWRLDPNADARDALSGAVQEAGALERMLYAPNPEHTRETVGVGLTADGRLAVAGYADGSLVAWRLDGTRPSVRWQPAFPPRRGSRAAVSPDGRWAAIGFADGGVTLVPWQSAGFGASRAPVEPAASTRALPTMVSALAFSHDSRRLAVGWSDGRVQLLDLAGGGLGPVLGDPFDAQQDYHRLGVLALAFSVDDEVLASSHGGAKVRFWKTVPPSGTARNPLTLSADASSILFAADGREMVLAVGAEGRIQRLGLNDADATLVPHASMPAAGAWTQLAQTSDGELLVQSLSSALLEIPLDDSTPAQPLGPRPLQNASLVAAAARAPRAAVGLADGTIHVYDLARGAAQRTTTGAPAARRLAFDAAGDRLYVVGGSAAVRGVSEETAALRPIAWPSTSTRASVVGVASTAAGVAMTLSDGTRWRCDERECRPGEAGAMAGDSLWQDSESSGAWRVLRPGGARVCSSSRCEAVEPSRIANARRFALSTRPRTWAFATDREVHLCRDGHCGRVAGLEPGSEGWIGALAFTPAGEELVVATSEGLVRFIDTRSGSETVPARATASGAITRIAFDETGRLMATGGRAGTVQLWDLLDRRPLGGPSARTGIEQVVDIALSPNGSHLAVLYSDGFVALRMLEPEALAARACAMAGRSLSTIEWQLFGGAATDCPAVCPAAGARCLPGIVRAAVHR